MTYLIELSRAAQKALKPIPKADLKKICTKIDRLKINPMPNGCEKIEGEEDLYRIRSGDYRIVIRFWIKN